MSEVFQYLTGLGVATIGYFLRYVHSRMNDNEKKLERLNTHVDRIDARLQVNESIMNGKLDNIEKVVELKLEQLNERFRHMDNNFAQYTGTLKMIIDEIKKK